MYDKSMSITSMFVHLEELAVGYKVGFNEG